MTFHDLYEYYQTQHVRPTFADFRNDAQLARYADVRRSAMYRLTLPAAFFDGKRVLEFGPDTGENALVFAGWGARMTLVEPNRQAHPYIRAYFEKFGAEDRLEGLVAESLLGFTTSDQFDVIDAEGFIYTVQPTSAWIEKTASCLRPGGLLIISYMEFYGGFMELLLKALYQALLRSGAAAGVESAKKLFQAKWDSIPHTRTIESWFMDVIANPFVRLRYFLDPAELLREADAGGFRLHSSWPNYRDMLSMRWIKSPYSTATDLETSVAFIEQSRLSHFTGTRCFLPRPSSDLTAALRTIIEATDALIDDPAPARCREALTNLRKVMTAFEGTTVVASQEELAQVRAILAMIARAFEVIASGDSHSIVDFCRGDATLIATWGTPAHYAVFQKSDAA